MEDNTNLLESLIEKATDYGKTSFQLVKLRAIDKTSEIVSSFIPYSIVLILIASFVLFVSLGMALWLGEITGKIYYGFFVVAAFYGFTSLVYYLFFYKRMKQAFRNHAIKQMLK